MLGANLQEDLHNLPALAQEDLLLLQKASSFLKDYDTNEGSYVTQRDK
jgi:hypothetical protein